MNSTSPVFRSLMIYAVCVPLAIFIGYLLKDPLTYSTLAILSIVAFFLAFPLLVKWHYPLLLLSWGMPCTLIFLKGQPNLWLAMGMLTLGISVLERTLVREKRFVNVPQIIWPLLLLVFVVLMTAKLTGGFGLRAFGSDVYGGKKYIFLLAGIISYFALTSRPISLEKVNLYVTLFFLGALSSIIGDFFPIAPRWMEFMFWFFPPTRYEPGSFQFGVTRLGGVSTAASAVFCWMLARYGIRGIFLSSRLWRLSLFIVAFLLVFLGGFRSALILLGATFVFQFFLEGLHRTRLLPVMVLTGLLVAALTLPFINRLPFTFQRTLAFLPGLELSADAKMDAEASSEWRKDMWKALLPQVSQYFFLGKGYSISMQDFQMMGFDSAFRSTDASQQGLALSADYHNGPLSVAIPFGIWGVIAFFWLLVAGVRVTYCNFRYGDPALGTFNSFLFAYFSVLFVMFMFVGGGMSTDIARFLGVLGLSVSINNGMRRPAPKTAEVEPASIPSNILRPPRPSFQR